MAMLPWAHNKLTFDCFTSQLSNDKARCLDKTYTYDNSVSVYHFNVQIRCGLQTKSELKF